jgi:hypothetical protein
MVTSYVELGLESDSIGKAQENMYEYITQSSSRQRGLPSRRNAQISGTN